MNIEEYVKKAISETKFTPEGEFGEVTHYSWCGQDEAAIILEKAASLLINEVQNIYPNSTLETKKYPAPNSQYNVQIAVWR